MKASQKSTQSAPTLSVEQTKALEHIAQANHASVAHLVALAVDALVAEAARHDGRLPLPKNPNAP